MLLKTRARLSFCTHSMNSNYYDIYRCNVSVNLTREGLFELGRKRPFHLFTNYPVKIDEQKFEFAVWSLSLNEGNQAASTG